MSRSASRRSTSRRRSPSRYSSGNSLQRERPVSRYSPRSSAARSVLSYSSVRRSRSRDRTRSRSISRHTSPSIREILEAGKNTLDNHESRRDDEAQATEVPAVRPPDNRAPEALPTELPSDAPQEVPEHEIELQQEIVDIIGARLESDKKTAAAIHKDVALRWSEILKKGLPPEEVKILLEKYPTPENCGFISVPRLYVEITAAVQESAIKRDRRIVE